MKKYSFFFFAFVTLLISGAIHAQTDSIVKVTVKAIEKTDSTYTLQAALVLQKDWHVYANNADGITAPIINANAGTDDVFVLKINSSGTPQWAIAQGGTGNESVAALSVTSSGVAFAGSFASATLTSGSTTLTRLGSSSAFISRINAAGSVLGASFIGGSMDLGTVVGNLVEDNSGNFYLSGTFSGSLSFGATTLQTAGADYDAYLVKFSTAGTAQWAKRFGNSVNTNAAFVGLNVGGAGIFFDNGAQVPMAIGSQTSSAETTFFVRIGRDGQLP